VLGKAELDLNTLVWTRGAAFPIAGLESRLKCPLCGSRPVAVISTFQKCRSQIASPECRTATSAE
jgi:formate dehydrogenase maturation protein FdhE